MVAEECLKVSKDLLDNVNGIGTIKITLEWGRNRGHREGIGNPIIARHLGLVSKKAMKEDPKSHQAEYAKF
jgi:hypothetical protein